MRFKTARVLEYTIPSQILWPEFDSIIPHRKLNFSFLKHVYLLFGVSWGFPLHQMQILCHFPTMNYQILTHMRIDQFLKFADKIIKWNLMDQFWKKCFFMFIHLRNMKEFVQGKNISIFKSCTEFQAKHVSKTRSISLFINRFLYKLLWFDWSSFIDFTCQNRFNFWNFVRHLTLKRNVTLSLLRFSMSFFSRCSMNMIIHMISIMCCLYTAAQRYSNKRNSPATDQLSKKLGLLIHYSLLN